MKHPPGDLFTTLMWHTAAAFAVFAVLFLGVFSIGVSISHDQWQGAALAKFRGALEKDRQVLVGVDGDLQGDAVNRALMKVTDPSVFALVFRRDGTPVFWSSMGRSWFQEDSATEVAATEAEGDPTEGLPEGNRVAVVESGFRALKAAGKLTPLTEGLKVVGYLYVERRWLEMVEDNGEFLANLTWALAASLAGAAAGTTLFAWQAFRRSTRQAGMVQEGLTAISQGRRDVVFEPTGSRELEGIAEAALRLQSTLTREQDLRRRWTQDIAHDLKTPLTALRVQLEAIGGGLMTATPERVDILLEEVGQLESLTSNLLVLSRLESPELKLTRRPVELAELLRPLKNMIEPLVVAEGRELVWSETAGTVEGDAELLHRALSNLLVNALVHAEGEGPVEVSWSAHSGGFHGLIRNPGQLPAGQEEQLFHRLRRGAASRSGRGNGLGLTIARAVIQLHGGSLSLAAGPSATVEARVEIPLCEGFVRMGAVRL